MFCSCLVSLSISWYCCPPTSLAHYCHSVSSSFRCFSCLVSFRKLFWNRCSISNHPLRLCCTTNKQASKALQKIAGREGEWEAGIYTQHSKWEIAWKKIHFAEWFEVLARNGMKWRFPRQIRTLKTCLQLHTISKWFAFAVQSSGSLNILGEASRLKRLQQQFSDIVPCN